MPLEAVTVAVPFVPPLQLMFVCAVIDADNAVGCVIVALVVFVHPLASVTVTVYVEALKPVAVTVVCAGTVLHEYV